MFLSAMVWAFYATALIYPAPAPAKANNHSLRVHPSHPAYNGSLRQKHDPYFQYLGGQQSETLSLRYIADKKVNDFKTSLWEKLQKLRVEQLRERCEKLWDSIENCSYGFDFIKQYDMARLQYNIAYREYTGIGYIFIPKCDRLNYFDALPLDVKQKIEALVPSQPSPSGPKRRLFKFKYTYRPRWG